jgi:TatD DNase family protein
VFIDSHCHLDRIDLTPYGGEFARYLDEAGQSGLGRMLCVSINLSDYPAMRALVAQHPGIDVSVGVHPNETDGAEPTVDELVNLAQDDSVVALGETGLDYFREACHQETQQERFRRHIQAAVEVGKPLIVHTRNASEDTLRILREEGARRVGGVFHCFTEDWEIAQQALDLDFLISFSGVVTFRSAVVLQLVAQRIAHDRYLIETDSPYLAPVPFRGKPNYPHYVRQVAEAVAKLRNVELDEVEEDSSANYRRLFGIQG